MGIEATRAQHQSLLKELQEERAAALARISRRLERLLDQLHAAREQLHSDQDRRGDNDRARDLAAYRELHKEAVKYRWYLEVQREAIGLRQHEHLDEFYRIPPELS